LFFFGLATIKLLFLFGLAAGPKNQPKQFSYVVLQLPRAEQPDASKSAERPIPF
jgi:hypothetical protein